MTSDVLKETSTQRFLRDGYTIEPASDRAALDAIRARVAELAATHLGLGVPADVGSFLDDFVTSCDPAKLNDVRLAVIDGLLRWDEFRSLYFRCARPILEEIVGNELAMQRGVGFSIQLPNDPGSVLPLHSDAWSEDSAFEVVLWIPLVDVYRTKSMFLLPLPLDLKWRERMADFPSVDALFAAAEPDLRWLDIRYGDVLVFSHTVMHGNRMNVEDSARWSLNVRFKALFTPYSDKRLGEFFEPLTIRPASRIGMTYVLPHGFEE
jgi:sporadic carbohydrate cluster 2OG-Fe(II) oxygenase